MPLFKSFRSKSSLKSSGASIMSENDQSTDFGPRSPSSNTLASRKAAKGSGVGVMPSDYGSSVGRAGGKTQPPVGARMSSSPSGASIRTSPSNTALKQQQPNMMEFVQPSNGTGTGNNSVNSSPARPTGPRPSELFAGKGVQWDSVKLAGPGSAPAVQNRAVANNTEGLQNFLKQRRQWKPTFVTEESAPRPQTTTDLSKLTFLTQDQSANQAGIMSFDELDKSHERKQHLLSDNPLKLGASLWDEAETSKAGQARAAAAATGNNRPSASAGAKAVNAMNPPPTVKRSGSSFLNRRKSVTKQRSNGNIAAAAAVAASPPPLPRTSSAQASNAPAATAAANGGAVHQDTPAKPSNVTAPDRTEATTDVAAANSTVRPSLDTSAGFVTPAASSPPASTQHLANNADAAHISAPPGAFADTAVEPEVPQTPRANNVEAPTQSTPVSAA